MIDSGGYTDDPVMACYSDGAEAVVAKPYRFVDLQAALAHVLKR